MNVSLIHSSIGPTITVPGIITLVIVVVMSLAFIAIIFTAAARDRRVARSEEHHDVTVEYLAEETGSIPIVTKEDS